MSDGCILVLHIGNGFGLTLAGSQHTLELHFGGRQLKRLQVTLLLQGIEFIARNNTFLIQRLDLRKLQVKRLLGQFGHSEHLLRLQHLRVGCPGTVDLNGLLHFQLVGQGIPQLDFKQRRIKRQQGLPLFDLHAWAQLIGQD
ncbi:hypothetical protein [Pseudomonas kulmbachensis]|uniref:Uncharacterized protein n=1 Tax=Pseudomonas kulmbachensis TaxID=3043408 RepID=A0ABW7LVW4_9PSED